MSRGWKVRDPKSGRMVHLSRFQVSNQLPEKTVAAMYMHYQRGDTLAQVGRRFRRENGKARTAKTIHGLFERRGLKFRAFTDAQNRNHNAQGQFLPGRKHTAREIAALIEAAGSREQGAGKRAPHWLQVPAALRVEWRHWPMERRKDLILRLRAVLKSGCERPKTRFSDNVLPFDYWTPEAWEILQRENGNRPSREWRQRLFPCSQGVIWPVPQPGAGSREQGKKIPDPAPRSVLPAPSLWYWSANHPKRRATKGGAYYRGIWTREDKRPQLHRVIYERTRGVKLEEAHIVICADGNYNNLDPANLALITRAENGLRNHPYQRLKKNPQDKKAQAAADQCRQAATVRWTRRSRLATAALVQSSQSHTSGLFTALQRRAA